MAITMNHTGFVVTDLDRSLEFYRDALGLDVERRTESSAPALSQIVGYDNARIRVALLTGTDGHLLELIQYLNPVGTKRLAEEQYQRNLSGATHLAFLVDDIEAVHARLMQAGGTKLNPPVDTRPGVKACYLQDPDGNWVELLQDEAHKQSPFQIRQNTTRPS